MNAALSFGIEISALIIMVCILYYVVEQITAMPVNIRRLVQMLILLIAILAAIKDVLAFTISDGPAPYRPLSSVPSIIAPERR